MNEDWIQFAHQWLVAPEEVPLGQSVLHGVHSADASQIGELLSAIAAAAERASVDPREESETDQAATQPNLNVGLRTLMQHVASRAKQLASDPDGSPPIDARLCTDVYAGLIRHNPMAAAHALQILAYQGDPDSVSALAQSIVKSPPSDWRSAAVSLSPLWNGSGELLAYFFDLLGDGFLQAAILSVLLDLANYGVRSGKLAQHPWEERSDALASLLVQTIDRLRLLERNPAQFGNTVEEVQAVLDDGVALAISLCDTVGVMNATATEALREAMQLSHRRIQTEAAGALARLGVADGKARLKELAADPVARVRAVAYADELGLADEIDEHYRLPHALAESELAAWLAEPGQYGLAPSGLELMDQRTLYWPSYEEPRNCYLFRFWFDLPHGRLTNVGISGPVTHAFQSRLDEYEIDDIYAIFAGWHAEHEDIFELPVNQLNPTQRMEADRLARRLREAGYDDIELHSLAFFLSDFSLLAKGTKDGSEFLLIVDDNEIIQLPYSNSSMAATPDILLALSRGRRLLRAFND